MMTPAQRAKEIEQEIQQEHQRPYLPFTLEAGEPGIFESKTGGTPYLPRDTAWPLSAQGVGMDLLAQVDCSQLTGLEGYPHKGMLQFFVEPDGVWGCNFDRITDSSNFKVFYHETVDRSVTAEEVEAKRPASPEVIFGSPVEKPGRIVFGEPGIQSLLYGDFRFDRYFMEKWNARCPETPLSRMFDLYDLDSHITFESMDKDAPMHQLGGYPYFTQSDPRSGGKDAQLDTVLFQLDSDMKDGEFLVLWGDCGVANFFISGSDLAALEFGRVGYTWDCC